jgi:hypothetical protein
MRGKPFEVKRAEPKHPGRSAKSRPKLRQGPLYSHEGFVGSNHVPPLHVNGPLFPGYMAPMYYPYPPPMFAPPNDFPLPPPMQPGYYMGNYADPLQVYPMPSANVHPPPNPPAFLPAMVIPPSPIPAQSTQTSVMQPVAPGIPMNIEGETAANGGSTAEE